MVSSAFSWRRGHPAPVALAHTVRKHELIGQYVRKYLEITAGAAAAMPADVFKCTIIDAFSGGGMFRSARIEDMIAGTPLRILEAIEQAKRTVAETDRRKPLALEIATQFNDADEEAAAYLKEVLESTGYGVDGATLQVTQGAFADRLKAMIAAVSSQQPRAGKCIFILDQTGYTDVRPEHIREIFGALKGAEVILTVAAGVMFNRRYGLSDRGSLHAQLGGWLLRDDVLEMLDRGDQNDATRAVALRDIMEELVRRTGATGYSCFTLRPIEGNYMWIIHLVRNPKSIFARDTMLDVQWDLEKSSLHVGGVPADYLGFQGLRKGDQEQEALFRFELAAAERETLRRQYGESILERWLTRENLSSVGGVRLESILRETDNRTALTTPDRLRALSELRIHDAAGGLEWRDETGKQIGTGTNRLLRAGDTVHLARQTSLFGP